MYNIAIRAMGVEKSAYMKLLQQICDGFVQENEMKTFAQIYELIMYKVASYLGDMGEYGTSNKISNEIMETSLSLRRMNMIHMCVYNNLWNQMEDKTKNTLADSAILYKQFISPLDKYPSSMF